MAGSLPEDLIDLNAAARYDADLRQVPIDHAAIERAIDLAAGALADARVRGDDAAALRLLGYLGDACRLLDRSAEAVEHLQAATALARATADRPRELANLIRLAETHRSAGHLDRAEALFRDALARCAAPDLASYADFALQHLGKCRLDRGDPADAVACFERALALRRAKGDPALIRSTQQALRLARTRPAVSDHGQERT